MATLSSFLPWEVHGQRSLVSYSPWGHKESDMTEHTCIHRHMHRSTEIHRHTQIQTHTHRYTETHTHVHACTHTDTHSHRHTHTDIHVHTHTYMHVHTQTRTHRDTHTRTCMYTQRHTCTRALTHTHTHTHTHSDPLYSTADMPVKSRGAAGLEWVPGLRGPAGQRSAVSLGHHMALGLLRLSWEIERIWELGLSCLYPDHSTCSMEL